MMPHIEQYRETKLNLQIPSNEVQKYDLICVKEIGSDSEI